VGEASDKRAALKLWLRDRLTEGERPRAAKAVADRLFDPDVIAGFARPIVAGVAPVVIAELRGDDQPVGRFLPPEAREKLHEALARPGLVHPDWVRAMFRGEAAEAVLNDALYRALKDFSTLLPRLMVKVSPVGRLGVLGGAGAFAEKLIEELEKLIEPEIKSFLANSTERVLGRAAEFTIAKIDDPASIEFRATFVDFMLSKSPAFLLEAASDELIGDMGAVVELSARYLAEAPEMHAGIHGWIDRVMDYSSDKTLGEVLQLEESAARPPIDALADATWPAFIAVLASPQAQAWMDTLLDELIDEYERIAD
jgi:hypothetical protein